MVACIHGDKSQQERDIVLRGKSLELLLVIMHGVILFAGCVHVFTFAKSLS